LSLLCFGLDREPNLSLTHYEAFCPLLLLRGLEESHRIFNCAKCSRQVIICRACDRGDIYCSDLCAREQRTRSLSEAGKRYQGSFEGRRHHAARQAKYRERHSASEEKVTHHGSTATPECGSTNIVTTAAPVSDAAQLCQRISGPVLLCHKCKLPCGALTRRDFWRAGRPLKRHTKNGHIKRDGGGNNSPVPG
jgi:hypothetical protein